MKFEVVIVFLGLCSNGWLTEARHVRPQSSPEEEAASNRIVQCQGDVMGCAMSLMKYQSPDPVATARKLKDAGAQQFCNDMKPILSCVSQKMKQPACADYPEQFKVMFTKGVSVGNTLCVDKINDLKKHWNCLLDSQTPETMSRCDKEAEQLQFCNSGPLTNCVANLFANRPGCAAGADDFVREIFPQVINVGNIHCQDRPNLFKTLLEFARFK